jgi:hypothetical protein
MNQAIHKLKYDILAVIIVLAVISITVFLIFSKQDSNTNDNNNNANNPTTNNIVSPPPVVKQNINIPITETKNTTLNETTPKIENPPLPVACDNLATKANFYCDTKIKGYNCSNINDNNLSSIWFSNYVCTSGNNPCSIITYVNITSQDQFNTIQLYNRPEEVFFINRVLISYNNHTDVPFIGGHKYTSSPWPISLNESTNHIKIKIVEVFGAGKNYATGIAEIKLFQSNNCIN